MAKYLDYSGLQHLVGLIKNRFIQKDGSKMLSDNNYSDIEKTKLTGIQEGAEKNDIIQIKKNGSIITPVNRVVDVNVPVKVSDLTNDSKFQTLTDVQSLIVNAQHMKKEIVTELPTTGAENTIYLILKDGSSGNNVYSEYLWIDNKWELIGDTSTTVDLTGYLQVGDIGALTTQEIETAMGA